MHYFVTGAGGFLGLYIVEQLVERGDQVRALVRSRHPRLDELGVECVRGDIRDAELVVGACRDAEAIIHAAGVAGIWGPWRHYHGINTIGTQNVIRGALEQGAGRLVYTSSPSVIFDGNDHCGIDETVPYPKRWMCHYQRSKALAEQAVLAANGQKDLRTCALRPHLIWGPRDRHLIPRLIDRARRGHLRRVGDGTNLIDMVYVENAARAHLQAADALTAGSPVCGRAYFITQGEPVNCWQWINEILELAGLPEVKRSVSLRTAWVAGTILEGVYSLLQLKSEPGMTRFLAAQLAHSHYFSIDRAQRDFGYEPEISTSVGMRRLADELRDLHL
jgi:nucleoside-diphosphate-sugar epimerase